MSLALQARRLDLAYEATVWHKTREFRHKLWNARMIRARLGRPVRWWRGAQRHPMEVLLPKIGIVFLLVTATVGLFHRFRIPGIVGLVIAGVIVGPHGLGILEDRTHIALLSEFGIILLMFSIGLDFDQDRLLELRRSAGIGFFQIGICIACVMLAYPLLFEGDWRVAMVFGFLVSHTSSTLMLKIYGERGEISTAPARLGVGVSITQDLASVPMLITLPLLAYGGSLDGVLLNPKILHSGAILAGMGGVARWGVPPLLRLVVQSRSRELILFFLILVCLGASWATYAAGLSAALGAFIAGLALARSHFSHQIHAEVSPLRDLLVSLFFISVGMLVNTGSLVTYAPIYLPALSIILIIKFVSGFAPVLTWGYPLRIATEAGVAIAQVGEFSLVLVLVSLSLGLIDDVAYQVFTIIAVLSMLLNPFLIGWAPRLFRFLHRLPMPRSLKEGRMAIKESTDDLASLRGHVLIAGYGLNGRNLARALKSLDIPYAAAELAPESVAKASADGERVYYGDCTRPDMLRRLQIEHARVFVVAISDQQATRRAVQVARQESAAVHIIVRTRYVYDIEHLLAIGANEVIPEEFETSLEILARTLHEYQVPRRSIDQAILRFRSGAYEALRRNAPLSENRSLLEGLSLALEIETARVRTGHFAAGKTLRDLALPSKTGVVILAIRKGDEVITGPAADYAVAESDMLILVGMHEQLVNALDILEKGPAGSEE